MPWLACIGVLLLATVWPVGVCPARAEAPRDAWVSAAGAADEPKVTAEEAQLLDRVKAEAGTHPAGAIQTLQAATVADSSAALHFAMGVLRWRNGQPKEAIAAFRQAVTLMPAFTRARANLARVLVETGDYAGAANELRLLTDSWRGDRGEFWGLLGYALLSSGQPVAAESAYRQAVIYAPDSEAVQLGLVKALVGQGALESAVPLIKSQLERHPENGELWALLANADIAAGRTQDALVRLEAARRLGAAGREALAALGDLFLDRSLYAEALAAYKDAAALEHPPVDRLLRAAEAFVLVTRVEEARQLLQSLDSRKPALTPEQVQEVGVLNARLAALGGKPEAAVAMYREVLTANPLHGKALLALGDLLRQQGEPDEAAVYYERAARIPAMRAVALVRQGQLAVDRRQYEHAVECLEESVRLEPKPYVEAYLGQVRRVLAAQASAAPAP